MVLNMICSTTGKNNIESMTLSPTIPTNLSKSVDTKSMLTGMALSVLKISTLKIDNTICASSIACNK